MDNQIYGALGQQGVGFILGIVIGAIAGWLAEKITKSKMGIFSNIIIGIIGALVGSWLASLFQIDVYGFWRNLISATIGAVILIYVYRAIRGRAV
jgi:uncharacterized membrane protein YeaQ/YmgE (transglycosylase-associated protein family)